MVLRPIKLNMTDNSYPSVMTPTEIDSYLKNLNNTYLDWDLQYFEGTHYFELQKLDINNLNCAIKQDLDQNLIQKYFTMDTKSIPPIVVMFNHIVDGYHRADALKKNNQSTIYAYVLKSKLEYGEYV